ncbi:MAG: VTT domain-containing protein [Lachnospiraceae bacterium]|nr:VTT domain-containing protein [Lachnospiraceae bacterium]
MKSKETILKTLIIFSLTLLLSIAAYVLLKGWIGRHFHSIDTLRNYISSYGILAPLILTLIQLLLAILPICPSFTGCIAGAALFGAAGGFWTNYIGICAGSIIAYFLAKYFGIQFVTKMLSMQKYESYIEKINTSKSYPKLLFLAILLPMAPDNFLCYFSGLMNMSSKKFITIIITAKPWCILFYSIFFAYFI